MTESEKEQAAELYRSGMTIRRIARLLHHRSAVVSDFLLRTGLRKNARFDSLGRIHKQEVKTLHERGLSVPVISKQTSISVDIVYRILREEGIDNSPEKIFKTEEQQQVIADLYARGFTGVQIARDLGVSQGVIYRELRRQGLTRRSIAGPRSCFMRYVDSKGRLTRFRSTWEAAFAKYLDDKNLQWAYEAHAWLLSDGSAYIPDFWVPQLDAYFEVKGWTSEESARKLALFRDEYPQIDLRIVDRDAFKEYGIDLNAAVNSLATSSRRPS